LIIAAVVLFATGVFSGESPEDIAARKEEERKAFLFNYINKEMVQIPGGSFVFGGNPRSEVHEEAKNPEQSMSLEKFSISKTEVTRYQWNTLMGDKKYPDALTPDAPGANLPANHVTWSDARDFSDAMNKLLAKHDDGGLKHFGLPTQVQWESR
jgi:formylglycine-generating enzyme required for sulfatase activity